MKSNEIMQALNLIRSKETMNFCSKLASVYEFIKLVKADIIDAAIVETGLSINDTGKVLQYERIESDYLQSKIHSYEWHDKETETLQKEINSNYSELRNAKDQLWKKRKNKDNSELESEISELQNVIKELQENKELLVMCEATRLHEVSFTIEEMRQELNLFTGNKIMVETKQGMYAFYLPVDNAFYYEVCRLLNIECTIKGITKQQDKETLQTISFDKTAFKAMATACKFISRDDLRPAMQHVCLAFHNNTLEVVATDAHRLFMSKKVNSSQVERLEILISEKTAKQLSKIRGNADLHILANGEIMVNGVIYSTFDGHFPNYRCVVPEYKEAMLFDRVKFIDNCKKVLPHANKSTGQITFHLNGTIAMHCEDIDFGMEADAAMPYVSKDFKDVDIAFNGKLLTDCLSIFKEKQIKMYSNGENTKCATFTNGIDTALLMPLMLHN